MSEGFNDPPGGGGFTEQPGSPPPRKSNAGKVLLIVFGIAAGLLLVCCGGFLFLGNQVWKKGVAAFNEGMAAAGEQVGKQVQSDPNVQQHIGQIQECKLNFSATMERAEQNNNQGEVIFDLTGTKGSGKLAAKMEGETLTEATLLLPSGEEIPLTVEQPGGAMMPTTVEQPAAPASDDPFAPAPSAPAEPGVEVTPPGDETGIAPPDAAPGDAAPDDAPAGSGVSNP